MNDELEPVDDERSGHDESEPSVQALKSPDAPRPPGNAARRSRPSPGIGMVKSIEAFDDFSSISIRPSNKPSASPAKQPHTQQASPETTPDRPAIEAVTDPAICGPHRPVAAFEDIAREPVSESGPRVFEPAVEANAWPQWLLAVALFGGVFWYLLSVEPSEQSPTREPPTDDSLTHE